MLFSKEDCTGGRDRPYFALWFGNFFEPYYSRRDLVREGMREIAGMGFNAVILDSKLWEDFTAFFATGRESEYVAMQRYMVEECARNGMGVDFLTLFYNGDNLYPHIRDSRPDIINPVVGRDGKPLRGYRHWDRAQTEAMVEHTVNLYEKLAGEHRAAAADENGERRTPCYFYHSPALMPSFDEDGRRVYLDWLADKYGGIDALNSEYGMSAESFEALDMPALWPELTAADYAAGGMTARMRMHRDNMLFRQDMLERFYAELTRGVRARIPNIYLYDCLSQWKYFLTDWVEISGRGLDIWRLGKYLDCPSFYTLPADACGEANCYAVSFENAILRSASRTPDLTAGLFLGRYLFNDIYGYVTPAEAMASCLGAGATDMFFYGYSGLDDGGNFAKWDADRKRSVKEGLDWFAAVREVSGRRVSEKTAAIVFPCASFTMEDRRLHEACFRAGRNDALGYYQQLTDLGINADILDRSQIAVGALGEYKLVILPADPWYRYLPDPALEAALLEFVKNGGTVIAGASCGLQEIFGVRVLPHAPDSFAWEEEVTDFSECYVTFENAGPLAYWCGDGKPALAVKTLGRGRVYLAGLDLGRCYCERPQKPVPAAYGRRAQYPVTVLRRTPVEAWVTELGLSGGVRRGIERVPFENGVLYINHTPYDFTPEEPFSRALGTAPFAGTLYGHKAVFLRK